MDLDIKRYRIGPRMSRATVHNGTVYLAVECGAFRREQQRVEPEGEVMHGDNRGAAPAERRNKIRAMQHIQSRNGQPARVPLSQSTTPLMRPSSTRRFPNQ